LFLLQEYFTTKNTEITKISTGSLFNVSIFKVFSGDSVGCVAELFGFGLCELVAPQNLQLTTCNVFLIDHYYL
jgi:hypothetical protein